VFLSVLHVTFVLSRLDVAWRENRRCRVASRAIILPAERLGIELAGRTTAQIFAPDTAAEEAYAQSRSPFREKR
jgi:hypothetical protein